MTTPAEPDAPATRQDASDEADVLEALVRRRYSCRSFRPDAVPRDIIARIVRIAGGSASWCNVQPWKLTIVGGRRLAALAERLSAHAGSDPPAPDYDFPLRYTGPRQARRRECGLQLYDSVGIARGDRDAARRQALENFRFFGAPHAAILTSHEELGTYGAVDCGAFVSTFLLAARALGVDSIPQAAIATYPDIVRQELGLGAEQRVVCAISFGYADERHPANSFRTRRAEIDEIATWLD